MNKIKIVIVLSARTKDGGAYQYAKTLLAAVKCFSPSQYDIIYLYVGDKKNDTQYKLCENEIYTYNSKLFKAFRKVLIKYFPSFNIISIIGNYLNPFNSTLNKLRPDFVIFSAPDFNVLSIKCAFAAPIHDLMHLYEKRFPEVNNKSVFKNKEIVNKKICLSASAILVDSEYGKKQLIKNYKVKEENVFILPYVAQELYRNDDLSLKDLFDKYKVGFQRYIFYPAQLWKHKNHINLIRSISLAKANGITINLVLCGSRKDGDSPIFDSIKENSLEEQVRYLEYVSDMELITLYQNAVALVMPTYFGPTNIPPLEAFQLGCPVLISNIYGIPEQVGNAALLFNPDSVEEIYQAIVSVWNNEDLRKTLIENGFIKSRSWNQKHFNENFYSIINRIISAE